MASRFNSFARQVVKAVFTLRIPGGKLHRALAFEYQARHLMTNELQRIFYFQPMFEARCASVGKGLRLELTAASKFPAINDNVAVTLGESVRMSALISLSGARNAPQRPTIKIGDGSYVGHRVVLRAGTDIDIGKHVLIASNVLLSGDPGHPLDAVARRTQPAPADSLGRIEIGDDVWLAYGVTVVGNVRIGEGAVIAANSVVTRDVPPYSLVAGNPGRVLRSLKTDAPATAPSATSKPSPAQASAAASTLRQLYQDLFVAPGDTLDAATSARLDAVLGQAWYELQALAQPSEKTGASSH